MIENIHHCILHEEPFFPSYYPNTDFTDLIKQLLVKDTSKRLADAAEIKTHRFFKGIDFKELSKGPSGSSKVPFIPKPQSQANKPHAGATPFAFDDLPPLEHSDDSDLHQETSKSDDEEYDSDEFVIAIKPRTQSNVEKLLRDVPGAVEAAPEGHRGVSGGQGMQRKGPPGEAAAAGKSAVLVVKASSAGFEDGDKAEISINGAAVRLGNNDIGGDRGLHVVVINP